jgi:hypothetical protein
MLKRRSLLKITRVTKKSTQNPIGGSFFPSKSSRAVGVAAVCAAVVVITSCVLPLPVIEEGVKLQLLRLPAGVMAHEDGPKVIVPL